MLRREMIRYYGAKDTGKGGNGGSRGLKGSHWITKEDHSGHVKFVYALLAT